MSISISRKIATDILVAVEKDKAYSNLTVSNYLKGKEIKDNDKALISTIVYGTLDRKLTLDYIISKYVKTPINHIKIITLTAIRIALYQIIYLDKIPNSAAVNESVNIVKASKEKFNSSFVNGVLRAYLRSPIVLPDGDDINSVSVKYSAPIWLVKSFVNDYGFETAKKLLESSLTKPPVSIRVNTVKTNITSLKSSFEKNNIKFEENDIDNSLNILGGIDVASSKEYTDGLFYVQDEASQIMISKIPLEDNMRILDICAAPGGKSFTLAQYLHNTGEILSLDLYDKRVELISKGAKRLGLSNIKTAKNDATVFNESLGNFDVVLCDVPCSGLGVLRRKPEIKYKEITAKDFDELKEIQLKILENGDLYTKVGGTLVYSTCTTRKAENDGIISAFLDKHSGFDVKYINTLMPHIDGTDGFFYAILKKNR